MSAFVMSLAVMMMTADNPNSRISDALADPLAGRWEGSWDAAMGSRVRVVMQDREIRAIVPLEDRLCGRLRLLTEGPGKVRGNYQGNPFYGIYKQSDDRLFICIGPESCPRPASFAVVGKNFCFRLRVSGSGK
jgi:hypothetical protein